MIVLTIFSGNLKSFANCSDKLFIKTLRIFVFANAKAQKLFIKAAEQTNWGERFNVFFFISKAFFSFSAFVEWMCGIIFQIICSRVTSLASSIVVLIYAHTVEYANVTEVLMKREGSCSIKSLHVNCTNSLVFCVATIILYANFWIWTNTIDMFIYWYQPNDQKSKKEK